MWHLRILPDGGVLVADSSDIVRLDASGNQIQHYFVLTEVNWWTGLDIAAGRYLLGEQSRHRERLPVRPRVGSRAGVFNTGAAWTAVGVAVKP